MGAPAKSPAQTYSEQAEKNSKAYLAMENPLSELSYMTVLTALTFEQCFDTELAEVDGPDLVFRIPQAHYYGFRFGLDEVAARVRKLMEDYCTP